MSDTNHTAFPGPSEETITKSVKRLLEDTFKPKIYQHCLISFLNAKRVFTPSFIRKIRGFYHEADVAKSQILEILSDEEREGETPDCQKGCHYCCGLTVKAAIPEFYIIFEYLLKTLTEKELADLQKKLQRYKTSFEQCETRDEKLAMPCTFLIEGACSIYSVRPLACRAWNSSDRRLCQRYLLDYSFDIPTSISHYAPYDAVQKAIINTLHVAGLKTTAEELNSGMLRLFEDEFGDIA